MNTPVINKTILTKLLGFSISLGLIGPANAELIGIPQSYPDITLNQSYLIYDNNAINSNTGLLKVVSFGSTLNEGPGSGNSTLSQSYVGGTDRTPKVMLSIAIDRATGNWASSNHNNANKVTIDFGNSVTPNGSGITPGFKWAGDINNFGWQQNISSTPINEYGTFFDASWTVTQDDYEDMPASMSQFVDNVLTNQKGGIKISNSAGFGDVSQPSAFKRDWVFGTNASMAGVQNLLNPFLTGLSTDLCSNNSSINCITYLNSTVTADVFVPIPPAFWLWAGALGFILPSIRGFKNIIPIRRS